jgi:signal transduction histidine kinase
VRLAVHEGQLRLEVGAEGRGISPRTLKEVRQGVGELGVAIAGMRERIARLGGTLEINSTHTGTWVTATLPVDLPP